MRLDILQGVARHVLLAEKCVLATAIVLAFFCWWVQFDQLADQVPPCRHVVLSVGELKLVYVDHHNKIELWMHVYASPAGERPEWYGDPSLAAMPLP